MEWIILDIAAVLIIALFIAGGAAKGFAHTFVSFVGFFISGALAFFLSEIIADFAFDFFLRDSLISTFYEAFVDIPAQGIGTAINAAIGELPSYLSDAIYSSYSADFSVIDVSTSAMEIAENVVDSIIAPVIVRMIRAVATVVIFIISIILFAVLAKLTGFIKYVPIIGGLNAFLGGVVGFVCGVIMMIVVANTLYSISALTGNTIPYISTITIEETYIFSRVIGFTNLENMFEAGYDLFSTVVR